MHTNATEATNLREPTDLSTAGKSWRTIGVGVFIWTAVVVLVATHGSSSAATNLEPKKWLAAQSSADVMSRMDIVSEGMDMDSRVSTEEMKEMSSVSADNHVYGATRRWIRVPGTLKHVSMARNGAMWGVNRHNRIYHSQGYCGGKFSGWKRVPGGLMQISVGGNHGQFVIGVNAHHHIYERLHISLGATAGLSWRRVPGGLKDVSTDRMTWGVNRHDKIYRRTGASSWHMIGGRLVQINTGGAHIVGVNKHDHIYTRIGPHWRKLPGAATCASQAADGEMWVVNRHNNIYRWVRSRRNWVHIGGKLKQIHVASRTQIIGVNRHNHIYMRA